MATLVIAVVQKKKIIITINERNTYFCYIKPDSKKRMRDLSPPLTCMALCHLHFTKITSVYSHVVCRSGP